MESQSRIISRIFFQSEEKRLRAGWRLAGQLVIMFLLLIVLSTIFSGGKRLLGKEPSIGFIEAQGISAAAITVSIWVARRLLDRRSFISLGLQIDRQTWRDLLAGFLLASIMLLVIYAIERLTGWLTIVDLSLNRLPAVEVMLALVFMFLVFSITGWQEEIYFRGYLLTNLSEGINHFWAVLFSSLVFGMVHLLNPHPSAAGVAGIFFFGLLMAYACQRSGRLWLAIGLHSGWNFIEGPLLGFPVSGLTTFRLFHSELSGPELLTGGAFGPEAGLVLIPALTLGAVFIWVYTRSKQADLI